MKSLFAPIVALVFLLGGIRGGDAAPIEVPLAGNGRAAMAVTVAAGASDSVKKSGGYLADYLGRISGAKFEITPGDGKTGLAVGTAADFPALGLADSFAPSDPTRREEYMLRSHPGGVYLVGATEEATRFAVWDLLHRLGYRQFFPGANWEVVPKLASLKIAVDSFEKPDYLFRRMWYGFGTWSDMRGEKGNWDERNRMGSGFEVNSGHAYDAIITANRAEFEKHPEYFSSRKGSKLCVSNPGLRQLVVEYALEWFGQHPEKDSISMEPSDGGWPDDNGACGDGQTYASYSDRVVTLANEVAEAVNKKFMDKYVGIYAYYMHSASPSIKVNPHVVVNVATAYIQGGFTFDQLMEGWRKQGAQLLGVREYYSVFEAHRDKPGGPHTANLKRFAATTPHYYELGGRLMSAESSESWGASGLGFYVASRQLWDVKEKPDDIVEDFLTRAFGPAKETMREFYQLIDKGNQPLYTRDLLGRMYRLLDAARKRADDPGIRARLDDLVLYTRYCEMNWELENTPVDKKAQGEAIMRFTYRWRKSAMLHTYVLWRHSFKFDKAYPAEVKFLVPEGKNPWKKTEDVPVEEIEGYLRQGIANNPIATFTPVWFSRDLVPPKGLGLKSGEPGGFGYLRLEHSFYVWVDQGPKVLNFEVTGGQIAPRANTTLTLYHANGAPAAVEDDGEDVPPAEEAEGGPRAAKDPGAVDTVDVPNDMKPHAVTLKAPAAGLYRLRVVDRGKGAGVRWPAGSPVVIESSKDVQTLLRGPSRVYFYVPKGTKVIGGFARSKPAILDPDGKAVMKLPLELGAFSIPVPAGQDGKLWSVDRTSVTLLMTVPPYLARSADEMLVPKEIVAADAR